MTYVGKESEREQVCVYGWLTLLHAWDWQRYSSTIRQYKVKTKKGTDKWGICSWILCWALTWWHFGDFPRLQCFRLTFGNGNVLKAWVQLGSHCFGDWASRKMRWLLRVMFSIEWLILWISRKTVSEILLLSECLLADHLSIISSTFLFLFLSSFL